MCAWRIYPTVAEDREQYCGSKGKSGRETRVELDVGDPELEHSALLWACTGDPVAELRALNMRACQRGLRMTGMHFRGFPEGLARLNLRSACTDHQLRYR